ncbi:Holliday junction branch migration protein RuvA [Rickettsiales bacterium]|nr:Holliday junction branch migration protein RuvA [Rickettsiales bacterium]
MIVHLKGVLEEIDANNIAVLDVNGVGYQVFVDGSVVGKLTQNVGKTVKLFIHCITKEDGSILYGFDDIVRKSAFIELIKVSGVSGKIGIKILSMNDNANLNRIFRDKDISVLTAVSGVGKKLAQRILNEMKDLPIFFGDEVESDVFSCDKNDHLENAASALINLGITRSLAVDLCKKAIQNCKKDNKYSLEEIIKLALNFYQDTK